MLIDVYTKWYTTPINYDNIVNITCSKGIQKITYMQTKKICFVKEIVLVPVNEQKGFGSSNRLTDRQNSERLPASPMKCVTSRMMGIDM